MTVQVFSFPDRQPLMEISISGDCGLHALLEAIATDPSIKDTPMATIKELYVENMKDPDTTPLQIRMPKAYEADVPLSALLLEHLMDDCHSTDSPNAKGDTLPPESTTVSVSEGLKLYIKGCASEKEALEYECAVHEDAYKAYVSVNEAALREADTGAQLSSDRGLLTLDVNRAEESLLRARSALQVTERANATLASSESRLCSAKDRSQTLTMASESLLNKIKSYVQQDLHPNCKFRSQCYTCNHCGHGWSQCQTPKELRLPIVQ